MIGHIESFNGRRLPDERLNVDRLVTLDDTREKFEAWRHHAHEVKKPSKSLHRMLGPGGNPNTENFFSIVSALQRKTRVRLSVIAY